MGCDTGGISNEGRGGAKKVSEGSKRAVGHIN
jgi:hypothetical protein